MRKESIWQKAAARSFVYNMILSAIVWTLVLFIANSKIGAALSYEVLLNAVILLLIGVTGITVLVFVLGILCGLIGKKGKVNEEN